MLYTLFQLPNRFIEYLFIIFSMATAGQDANNQILYVYVVLTSPQGKVRVSSSPSKLYKCREDFKCEKIKRLRCMLQMQLTLTWTHIFSHLLCLLPFIIHHCSSDEYRWLHLTWIRVTNFLTRLEYSERILWLDSSQFFQKYVVLLKCGWCRFRSATVKYCYPSYNGKDSQSFVVLNWKVMHKSIFIRLEIVLNLRYVDKTFLDEFPESSRNRLEICQRSHCNLTGKIINWFRLKVEYNNLWLDLWTWRMWLHYIHVGHNSSLLSALCLDEKHPWLNECKAKVDKKRNPFVFLRRRNLITFLAETKR